MESSPCSQCINEYKNTIRVYVSSSSSSCFSSCCDKDSAIIFTTGRLPDVNPPWEYDLMHIDGISHGLGGVCHHESLSRFLRHPREDRGRFYSKPELYILHSITYIIEWRNTLVSALHTCKTGADRSILLSIIPQSN
jgi:hypothetical protein